MSREAGKGVKRPYYLKKRGAFWYYRLNPESGLIARENLNYYTKGCRTREAAEAFMAEMLVEERETPTFRCYAEPFFIWGNVRTSVVCWKKQDGSGSDMLVFSVGGLRNTFSLNPSPTSGCRRSPGPISSICAQGL